MPGDVSSHKHPSSSIRFGHSGLKDSSLVLPIWERRKTTISAPKEMTWHNAESWHESSTANPDLWFFHYLISTGALGGSDGVPDFRMAKDEASQSWCHCIRIAATLRCICWIMVGLKIQKNGPSCLYVDIENSKQCVFMFNCVIICIYVVCVILHILKV